MCLGPILWDGLHGTAGLCLPLPYPEGSRGLYSITYAFWPPPSSHPLPLALASHSLLCHALPLLAQVREAWSFGITSSLSNWQPIMRGYYQECIQQQREQVAGAEVGMAAEEEQEGGPSGSRQRSRRAVADAGERRPPAVTGEELFAAGAGAGSGRAGAAQRGEGQQEKGSGVEADAGVCLWGEGWARLASWLQGLL